jgi:hypothetical protein
LHWNIRTRLRIVDTARGAVAFLLFLLPKPSVEAEQRQQMVPRATRSTVGFQLLDSQGTMGRIREAAAADSDPDHHSAGSTRALTGRPPVDVGGVAISFALIMEEIMGFGRGLLLWLLGIPLPIIILLALFWR